MNVFVSGTARGIGRAIAELFLKNGAHVVGFDILPASVEHENYTHFIADVSQSPLPNVPVPANIVVSNAGVQNSGRDIDVNLKGAIRFAAAVCRKLHRADSSLSNPILRNGQ